MRTILFFMLTLCVSFSCVAQNPEELAVRDVVVQLFKGMERGDSAMVHAAFAKEITMATIFRNKSNEPVIHHESALDGFLKAVGTPHDEVWYEEFWNLKIQIDGDLAQAWCDYAFYLNDTFSHCGVDAIHLHKQKDGWKIFHLTDTRRKQDCNVPKEIQDKHR